MVMLPGVERGDSTGFLGEEKILRMQMAMVLLMVMMMRGPK